jgi:hypothetical protein
MAVEDEKPVAVICIYDERWQDVVAVCKKHVGS